MALTDTAVRNAKPGDKPVKMFDASGLYLAVQPSGSKLWRLKYRFGGREKLLSLGAYPETTLRNAREQRDDARKLLASGINPSQARKDESAAKQASAENSFEIVARAWHAHWKASRSDHHVQYVLRRLEADVFPEIGARAIAGLKALDFVRVAKKVEARGALDIAKRSLQTCGQIMRYAVGHGIVERNPVADIKPADVLTTRRKVNYARVDAKELPELMRKMHAYNGSPYTRFALQLIALTFVRTSELIEARWTEFDLDCVFQPIVDGVSD